MANVNARRVEEILTSGITAGHYVAGSNITITENQDGTETIASTGGGGGGTTDYSDLTNKPSINNVTLSGNKTTSDLGIDEVPDVTSSDDGKILKASYSDSTGTYGWGNLSSTDVTSVLSTAQELAINSGIDSTKVAQIETNKNNILITNIPYLDVIIQVQGVIGSNTKIWKQGNHVFGQIVITSPRFNILAPIVTLAPDFKPAYEQIQPCVCMDAGELPITGYYNITTAGEIILYSESMNVTKVSIPIDFVIS